MKKWIRLSLGAILCGALILPATSCEAIQKQLTDKPIHTTEEVTDIAEEYEYSLADDETKEAIYDNPDLFAEDFTYADLILTNASDLVLFEKDTTMIGFADFESKKDAKSYFYDKSEDLDDISGQTIKTKQDIMNYEFFESKGEEVFYFLLRVDDTVLFVQGEPENYKDVQAFLEALEYM